MTDFTASPQAGLEAKFRRVRDWTRTLCAPLQTEDCIPQSMPDASPTKWHIAHTTWFFETFVLKPHAPNYQTPEPLFEQLFNSYYNAVGPQFPRAQRGLVSRPTLEQTWAYRESVEAAVCELLQNADEDKFARIAPLVTLGCHHEQQHQELILTDVKHLFSQNPLLPIYRDRQMAPPNAAPSQWRFHEGGLYEIGKNQGENEFSFDNEGPRHQIWLQPFSIASRRVTCGQWLEFMADGGYERSEFWLSLGWKAVQDGNWRAPLYWREEDGEWNVFTLHGKRKVEIHEPVAHVSYFEADAFARWSGARLPSEAEWEIAARSEPIVGNFAEEEFFHPIAPSSEFEPFGNLWCWTRSAYEPYPRFRADAGALGEYNGKFMCNQYVLRGGSCATPRSHMRATYRNFFSPEARWQFSGVRLAQDA